MRTERELFEEAFKKVNSGVSFWLNTWSDEDNDYGHLTASWGWHMWQASANIQGYKLAPVEPCEKTLNEIKEKHWDMRGVQLCRSDYNDLYKAMIGAIK